MASEHPRCVGFGRSHHRNDTIANLSGRAQVFASHVRGRYDGHDLVATDRGVEQCTAGRRRLSDTAIAGGGAELLHFHPDDAAVIFKLHIRGVEGSARFRSL